MMDTPHTTHEAQSEAQDVGLPVLLDSAALKDSFEYDEFYFRFTSGALFSKGQKHAVMVHSIDSVPTLEVYHYAGKRWNKILEDTTIDITWLNLQTLFDDMNFDGSNDLCVVRYVSNGWSMAGVHLYIYKSNSLLKKVPEADTLTNLRIERKQTLASEEITECKAAKALVTHTYKWHGDKLKRINTKWPCKPGEYN